MNSLFEVRNALSQIDNCKIKEAEPMQQYTSFHIGGPADLLIEPGSIEVLQRVLQVLTEANVPYFVLGKGSNVLFGDLGFRGVVIKMTGLTKIEVVGTRVRVEAGVSLAKLANIALEAELTGLEFASGIPGTLGGAIVMNAGAYGGEMKNVISKVVVLTQTGEKKVLQIAECHFSYRHSIFLDHKWIVVEAELELKKGDPVAIKAQMADLNNQRRTKQPLEFPSAGSTFKRPQGYFAGQLIEQSGLCGYSIGDAQVAEKHCGFIINRANASASDVLKLIRYVQNEVRKQHGVELEPEVRLVGEFSEQI